MRVIHVLCIAALTAATVLSAQDQDRVVRGLAFEGNRALDDLTLESVIATTKSSWWAREPFVKWMGLGEKRYFAEIEFRRDVVRLILFYRQSGYMNAVVDTLVRRTPRDVYITFRIHEGEPVRVVRLEVKGVDGILNVSKLVKDLPLQVGDPFNRFLMQASADTIVNRLRNGGYPYAEVLRNFDSEAGALRAEVEFDAEPGARMHVGEVAIRGLRDVDTGTVRRVMSVKPGNLFRQDALYQTQRDLYGIGVFNSVNVVLVDSLPPEVGPATADSTVQVQIQVNEGKRHQVRTGAGYGSYDCFRVQSGWTAHDFLGGARALDLSAKLSKLGAGTPPTTTGLNLCNPFAGTWEVDTVDYTLGVTLRQPAFLSKTHLLTLGLAAERRSEFGVYTREAVGGNLDVTLNPRGRLPVTFGYSYSVGSTQATDIVFCSLFRLCDEASRDFLKNRRQFGAVSVTVVRNLVNALLDPSEGSLMSVSVLHASRQLGSQFPYEFNRAEAEIAKYYPVGRRTVFAWRIRGGVILPKNIDLAGQNVGYVPPDQRFYGGGPTSVRGYGRNELGPRAYVTTQLDSIEILPAGDTVWKYVTTAPTGGNTVLILNAELRIPSPILSQRMRLGLFVDAGQVWERGEELSNISGLRFTPGMGLRFATPLGPVRFDAAYNGYPLERGPLLYQPVPPAAPGPIIVIRDDYPPINAPKSFWQKVVVQLSVGHAF